MDPGSFSGESVRTNRTVQNSEMGTGGRNMRFPTSWIISCKFITVVLLGAVLAVEGEPSEWSWFTPHPASASQFRIAPGSHPRLYPRVNVPVKKLG